ncbi:hypothetical protein VNO78_04809 [Psophocarpus tetragonolobus]|uniref:PGG domain-containing protein n=1 Tax=Psophocarpus tetragonolobus TaxID=3891 RepID=A0AAN9TGK6_PSOTE
MSNINTEGHSISRPPFFNGKNYTEWKERMRVFIKSVDFKLWLVIKNGTKIPTKLIDDEEVEKSEDEYDEDDVKNMELEAKARNILNCALNPDTFQKFSVDQKTAKEMWDKLDREMVPRANSTTSSSQLSNSPTTSNANPFNSPDLYFLGETRDAMKKFMELFVPLHKLALEGNWAEAKLIIEKDVRLKHAAIADGWLTLLHVVAGGGGHTPLHFAVMQGKCEMTWFLYGKTKQDLQDKDRKSLFLISVTTGNYHLAREWKELAYARDQNNDTALHILAQNQNPLHSCFHCPQIQKPIMVNPGKLHGTTCDFSDRLEAIRIISNPYQLLFDAAQLGHFGILSELISSHPDLIWEVDNIGGSIIHSAVRHRHADIFNLIHEIGSTKDVIVEYQTEGNNTLLHLAAKLALPDRLQLVSGAAFQMCHELIWFEEVKKIMPPSFIKMKNSEGLTAQQLFTEEHKGLRKEGEEWMKRTAEFCMLISTFIATAVFSSATNIPGGIDDQSKKPNYLDTTPFLIFAISDAIAFISSATATLIFLSMLISRYAEYDFYKSLPLKLIFGLVTLFISITCMMVALGSVFFITYDYGLKVVPDSISVLAALPLLLYIALQYSLWTDIIYSTFYCTNLFKPSVNMIYLLQRTGENVAINIQE